MKRLILCSAVTLAMLFMAASVRAVDGTEAAVTPAPSAAAPAAPALTAKEADLLKRFDTNHDGKLDDDELAAAHAQMTEAQVKSAGAQAQKFYARLLQQFDKDGDGRLNEAEQASALQFVETHNPAAYQRLIQRFDRNGDGKLDAQESDLMFAVLAKLSAAPAAAAPAAVTPPAPAPGGDQARATRLVMVQRLYDRLVKGFDKDGDGKLTGGEQTAALQYLADNNPSIYHRLLTRFDRNGDGKLDPQESDALFQMMAQVSAASKI